WQSWPCQARLGFRPPAPDLECPRGVSATEQSGEKSNQQLWSRERDRDSVKRVEPEERTDGAQENDPDNWVGDRFHASGHTCCGNCHSQTLSITSAWKSVHGD